MKKRYVIIISLVLLILDTSFISFFSINGIYPSLLFTFAIGYSIINGEKEGVFIGILTGILQDIFFFQGYRPKAYRLYNSRYIFRCTYARR